jgi:hypothetical protein
LESRPNNREPWPLCGYGRLGLCCSTCLLGPCRLSPFDEGPDHGRCGRDADQLIAFQLHQRVSLEALETIHSLGIGRLSDASPHPPPSRRFADLLPDQAFPLLRGIGFPPDSLLAFFFEQLEGSSELDRILTQTLTLSLVPFLCRNLAGHPGGLADDCGKVGVALSGGQGRPLLICLVEKESPHEAWVTNLSQAFRSLWGAELPILFSDPDVFPEIARRIYRERHFPVAFTKTLALVSASSLSSVLLPLTLGFRVLSYPPLPIHGGPKVEAFFSKGVLRRFGGQYISGREDLSWQAVMEELKWTTQPI